LSEQNTDDTANYEREMLLLEDVLRERGDCPFCGQPLVEHLGGFPQTGDALYDMRHSRAVLDVAAELLPAGAARDGTLKARTIMDGIIGELEALIGA